MSINLRDTRRQYPVTPRTMTTFLCMARTSRRTPRPGPLVALYADVDPEVKGRIDHWAAIADVKVWEVIEELVRLAQATEGHDGLPQGMAFTSPLLPDLNSPVPGADSSSAPPVPRRRRRRPLDASEGGAVAA